MQIAGLDPIVFAAAFGVALFAGFVKGAVGFAMPMIMISGLSSFLPAETALAGLILATVSTNVAQAFRHGVAAAVKMLRRYGRLIGAMVVAIILSAPLVTVLPGRAMLLLLGLPILAFTLSQLLGRQLIVPLHHRGRAEVAMGLLGGFFGGISGVWGPPVIAYLLSVATPKAEMVRVLGVVFLVGSVILLAAHLGSGVLAGDRLVLSAVLVVPAALGMALGVAVQDRLNPERFRKATLAVLALAAANLVRRGLFG
ncbi:putative membrane protein YfcA [Rhodovulum iodosum]|uniref:Probable membrane transporter protein n=1 Tax=Rhodovulum iodosum TaxID=68291 RepID=A0ABV3XUG1_9RHOB|nr:sulfite exporter TauE/SafE family protein [Rhodovulum robiginosum]RSK39637.1 sulfite exporter TauE/SafE family protein [Rhodovulum robiginosum]